MKDPNQWLKDAQAALDGVGDLLEKAGPTNTVRGTFNAAAIQGLQASGAADRMAKATEDTAKHTKTLVQRANTVGLTFTGP